MTRYEWLKKLTEYLKQNPTDECVEWPYGKSTGYGVLRVGGQQVTAHRVIYALYHNEEPGVNVNHICSNRACVNVAHLYVGTQYENRRDTALVKSLGDNGVIPPEKIEEAKARIREHRKYFEIDYDDLYCDVGRTKVLELITAEENNVSQFSFMTDELVEACKALIEYRRKTGALNFQLEKADDFITRIETILRERKLV